MAEAKAMCGSCGAGVPFGVERCPSCGEHLVWPQGGPKKCPACGQGNDAGAVTCSSCGARLGGGKPARGTHAKQPRQREAPPRRQAEPWQIIAVVAIVCLVALVLYVALSGTHTPAAGSAAMPSAPVTMPPMMQASPVVDIAGLEAAVMANPGSAEVLLRLANGLHDNGEFLRAVETYKKYLKAQPKNPDARVDMGVCYYQLGLQDTVNTARYFTLAVTEMEAALRGTPTHQPAAFNLGVVHLQQGELDISNRWFRKAVELGPGSDLGMKAQRLLQQHSSIP